MSAHLPPQLLRLSGRALLLATAAQLTQACSDGSGPGRNDVVARLEIRHADGRAISAGDSIPWLGGISVLTVARNWRGDSITRQSGIGSSDPDVLDLLPHISGSGGLQFAATGTGTATLTAELDGRTASVTLKTYLGDTPASWIWPDTSRIPVGASRRLIPRGVEGGTPIRAMHGFQWESSNPTVATVDGAGTVTAVAEGRTTIIAVRNGKKLMAEVHVFRYPAPLRFASVAVASGYSHLGSSDRACGVTTDGKLYCWGLDYSNGFGTDDPSDRCWRIRVSGRFVLGAMIGRCSEMPIEILPGRRFTDVAAIGHRTCALSVEGVVYCVVDKAHRPIAIGETVRSLDVGLAVGWGGTSACAVGASGAVFCWGNNDFGQLGNGTTTQSETPVSVGGGLSFESVRAGSTACGITIDGATYCWGANDRSQAGAPVGTDTRTPVRVPGGHRFVQVEPAGSLTCALDDSGSVYCWGSIGTSSTSTPTPVPLSGGLRFAKLVDGAPCGITPEGAVYRWDATLTPTTLNLPFPVTAYGSTSSFGYASGFLYPCGGALHYAIGTDGILYWWDNSAGKTTDSFFFHSADIPDGLTVGSHTPVRVRGQ